MFEYHNPTEYINAWFDYHPDPGAIERFNFEFKKTKVEVFAARDYFDTWLIKITYHTAQKAMTESKGIKPLSDLMGITQILIRNKLFLFQDQRF
jgi:hypothetical protein